MSLTVLPFIQQTMIRYIMTTYLILGVIGNLCNCIVFMKQAHRRTPCSIYFLFLSVFAIIHLNWTIIPFIYTLNHVDPQKQSLIYCKIRLYIGHILALYIRFLIVFACVDRYFITRTSVRLRSLSSVSVALKLIFIMCLVWMVAGLHILVFNDIRGSVCSQFDFYKFFYPIYQFTFVGFLPPVLMSIFGILTIRSLHERHVNHGHLRQKDRDLMRMLIAEIVLNLCTSIPYSANLLYGMGTFFVTGKSAERLEIEAFCTFVCQFIIYLLSVAPFYLFIASSKSFRNEFIQICNGWRCEFIRRQVSVVPINRGTI